MFFTNKESTDAGCMNQQIRNSLSCVPEAFDWSLCFLWASLTSLLHSSFTRCKKLHWHVLFLENKHFIYVFSTSP